MPNIRLMIAATIAVVLMLICGFGMFATFRVSHAPLERVASAASLHLVTTDAATPVMTVTAAAPFNNRFDVGEPGSVSVAALAYAAPEPAERQTKAPRRPRTISNQPRRNRRLDSTADRGECGRSSVVTTSRHSGSCT